MQAYGIDYKVNGKPYTATIDAKDVQSAKRKLGKRHGYKDGRMIKVSCIRIIGYY